MSSELEADLTAPRRRLWIAALSIVVLGGAAILALALRGGEPTRRTDASHRPTPPPSGAFADGGRPRAADPTVRHALAETLSDWIIALDRLGTAARENDPGGYDTAEADMAKARAELEAQELANSLGRPGAARLLDILARAHAAAAAASEPDAERAGQQFLEAVGAFNDALASKGHGFFLDGDVIVGPNSRRIVLLYAFTVQHVRLYDVGTRRIRALQLRRLDRLNWRHRLLGFTSPHLREALVLLDQVDELLVNYVLPALAPNAEVDLLDHDSEDPASAWQRSVRLRAGDVIREEYAATDGVDTAEFQRLGQLLHDRRRLFDTWTDTLTGRGISLRVPRTLRIDELDDFRRTMTGVLSDEQLDALDRLESALRSPANDRVFETVRDVIVASVERHEVQHRIDAARPSPLPFPAQLETYVGPARDRRGKPRQNATLARDELSAYSSALARDPQTTRVNLTLISRFLFDSDRWGSAECYAALVIFEGLAKELDIEIDGQLVEGGEVARELVATVYLALTERPVQEVRAAARRLWERLFEGPLPEIEIVHNEGDEVGGDHRMDSARGL